MTSILKIIRAILAVFQNHSLLSISLSYTLTHALFLSRIYVFLLQFLSLSMFSLYLSLSHSVAHNPVLPLYFAVHSYYLSNTLPLQIFILFHPSLSLSLSRTDTLFYFLFPTHTHTHNTRTFKQTPSFFLSLSLSLKQHHAHIHALSHFLLPSILFPNILPPIISLTIHLSLVKNLQLKLKLKLQLELKLQL